MTTGSDAAEPGQALNENPDTVPTVDVVKAALEHMFAGIVDRATDSQTDHVAVDLLVADAIDAHRSGEHNTVFHIIGTISDQYGREGVRRGISVLCGVVDANTSSVGRPAEEVEFIAQMHADLSGNQRAILVRSARLASDLVSATLAHDGPRLADALSNLANDLFDPVLSILVTHAAGTSSSTDVIRDRATTASNGWLCPTATQA